MNKINKEIVSKDIIIDGTEISAKKLAELLQKNPNAKLKISGEKIKKDYLDLEKENNELADILFPYTVDATS